MVPVGSNFFLTDRQLFPVYNLGFAEIYSFQALQAQETFSPTKSLSERERGFEPPTSSLGRKHSATELLSRFGKLERRHFAYLGIFKTFSEKIKSGFSKLFCLAISTHL